MYGSSRQEIIMYVGQELKDHAVSILDNLYPEIEINFFQSGGYDMDVMSQVRECIKDFTKRVVDTHVVVNPSFTKMAELAAELVYFGYHHPSEFGEMFSESAREWNGDIDVRTAGGLDRLFTFYASVCDDHDYCLDPTSDKPLVKLLEQVKVPGSSFGPNKLLSALQDYRNTLAAELVPQTAAFKS
jgi:hypothetical protein